jgi:hypothetical protein
MIKAQNMPCQGMLVCAFLTRRLGMAGKEAREETYIIAPFVGVEDVET